MITHFYFSKNIEKVEIFDPDTGWKMKIERKISVRFGQIEILLGRKSREREGRREM